jgi:hypothetical protein
MRRGLLHLHIVILGVVLMRSFMITLFCLLQFTMTSVLYAKSNKEDVQNDLRAKYDKVIFGKEIDDVDYIKFAAALASGPEAVAAYLEDLATQIATETGGAVGRDTLFQIINGSAANTIVGGKAVYVGIATYQNWTIEGTEGLTPLVKVPRPNTHQFYVAIGKKPSPSGNLGEYNYSLVNVYNAKLLDMAIVQGNPDGAQVYAWHPNGQANQKWRLVSVGAGNFEIVNQQNGKLLDMAIVQGNPDGAKVYAWHRNGQANQKWHLTPVATGAYEIVNQYNGKVLDMAIVKGDPDGAKVHAWHWNGQANQNWRLQRVH